MRRAFVFAVAMAATPALALPLVQSDFSALSDGDLVGQGGWTQLGTQSTLPIQVVDGRVEISAGQTVNNQDAILLGTPILLASGQSMYSGFTISVNTVAAPNSDPSGASYVVAMRTSDGTTGFDNLRVAARQGTAPGTFQFGIRATGQAANAFVFGGDLLLGIEYNVVTAWNSVAGVTNDTMQMFVNPVPGLANNSAYASATNLGTDAPGFRGFTISQFASTTLTTAGVSLGRAIMDTDFDTVRNFVPNPGAAALLGLGGLLAARRRRA